MRHTLSLSILTELALCTAGSALAQSRSVSTADMPKPGVSYISGPSVPVRKETVGTGTLPQPAHLRVGGQVSVGGGSSSSQDGYYGGNYASDNGGYGYYGGNYGTGNGNAYDRNDGYGRGDRDRDHDHGRQDQRPADNSARLAVPRGGANASASGPGMNLAPDRNDRDDNRRNGRDNDRGNGWNQGGNGGNGWNGGYNNAPPVRPGSGMTNSRAAQPGTGMGSGNQPGTGIPLRGNGR